MTEQSDTLDSITTKLPHNQYVNACIIAGLLYMSIRDLMQHVQQKEHIPSRPWAAQCSNTWVVTVLWCCPELQTHLMLLQNIQLTHKTTCWQINMHMPCNNQLDNVGNAVLFACLLGICCFCCRCSATPLKSLCTEPTEPS